ncbi:MAG TPA: PspC domain-containing protein [Candidatus Acidoferrales bacterium]|nr:PspC domain-containing protein [Candidatus Acidoferrales bacterium]
MQCPNCQRDITDYANFCYFCGAHQHASPVTRRLMRSSRDCKIAGVCGGIAEYLGVDSTVVRLIWVLAFAFSLLVPATLAYLMVWLVMPQTPPPVVAGEPEPSARQAAGAAGSAPVA